ncbi:hypothetical protein B9Z55_007320 [Caenorhabditis nigoni]|uniref:Uncharacterized protein n=1 Tax=Caenorhabditis nigoni TaxID=1611254 RepID=A0A2G5V9S9_9PELO|nr:hypothetical protein B9Z55_007320 [Caenorhabditis nigoni]
MVQTLGDTFPCQSHLNPLPPPPGSLITHQNLSNTVSVHPQVHHVPMCPSMHNQTYFNQPPATLFNGNVINMAINNHRPQEEVIHQLSCVQQEIQSLKRTIQNMESTMHANNFRPVNVTWMQAACRIRDLEEALSTKEMRLGEKSRRIEVLRLKLDKVNREIEEVRAESLRIQNEVVQNTNLEIFRIREEMEAQKEKFKKEKSQVEEDFKEFKKNAEIAMDKLVKDHKDQQNHWENQEGAWKRELEEKTEMLRAMDASIEDMKEKQTNLEQDVARLKDEHKIVIAGWSQKAMEIQSATDRKLNEAAEILTQERNIHQKEKRVSEAKIESLKNRIHEFEEKEAKMGIDKDLMAKFASRSYSKMMSSANKIIRDAETFKNKVEELGYEIKETPRKRKMEENNDEEDEIE